MGAGARACLGRGNGARGWEPVSRSTLRPEEGAIRVTRRGRGAWLPDERGLGAGLGTPRSYSAETRNREFNWKPHTGVREIWMPGFPLEWYRDFGYWNHSQLWGRGENSSPASELGALDSDC